MAETNAQKIYKNSITSSSNEIFIEFDIIDHIDLIVTEEQQNISILAESENKIAQDFTIQDKNGIVSIKTNKKPIGVEIKTDNVCIVQPIYTSYEIKIPSNKNVNISFTEGNFYSHSFMGNLFLKLKDGIAKIDNFQGKVVVEINGGNIYCTKMENVKIDAKSNLGSISSNIYPKNSKPVTNEFKELYGRNLNALNIRAISANIHLKAK